MFMLCLKTGENAVMFHGKMTCFDRHVDYILFNISLIKILLRGGLLFLYRQANNLISLFCQDKNMLICFITVGNCTAVE